MTDIPESEKTIIRTYTIESEEGLIFAMDAFNALNEAYTLKGTEEIDLNIKLEKGNKITIRPKNKHETISKIYANSNINENYSNLLSAGENGVSFELNNIIYNIEFGHDPNPSFILRGMISLSSNDYQKPNDAEVSEEPKDPTISEEPINSKCSDEENLEEKIEANKHNVKLISVDRNSLEFYTNGMKGVMYYAKPLTKTDVQRLSKKIQND
jgi:hypothetical protein